MRSVLELDGEGNPIDDSNGLEFGRGNCGGECSSVNGHGGLSSVVDRFFTIQTPGWLANPYYLHDFNE
jgi:hypothetical protein